MKKLFILSLAIMFIVPLASPALAESQVCGMDGETYASGTAAEEAGTDISYDFACTSPTTEEGLYEETEDYNFAGMLKEVGSTDIPTTLVISRNSDGVDFTIEVNEDTVLGQRRDQYTHLSDWIPGDQIRVIGKKNTNTENIEATILVNLSIKVNTNHAANGWITAVDNDGKTITYQWDNREFTFAYDDDTKFVVGLKNPASAEDLVVGDRIRARLLMRQCFTTPCESMAKIVVVLRRGEDLYMKIRTFRPNATLVRLDSSIVPTTIQVRIDPTKGLKANDVNNLIGTEGVLVTVNINEDTKIVRKYFGRTTLSEFSVGDKLFIVGRVNDDGTVDAKVIKNNSIWMTSTHGYPGVVTGVDVDNSYITINWTPIDYQPLKQLKNILNQPADNTVSAQTVAAEAVPVLYNAPDMTNSIAAKLKARLKEVKQEMVGKIKRTIVNKIIPIGRIQHEDITVGDLIKRHPAKKIRVDVTDKTKIVIGTNTNGSISDIQIGDKVRIRGVKHASLPIVTAQTIVVVNSLPEIEEPPETGLDIINAIVSVIDTDDDSSEIAGDTVTATEEEVDESGNIVDDDSDSTDNSS